MSIAHDDDMPDEIDFSEGSRGKFHRPDASVSLLSQCNDQARPIDTPDEAPACDDPAFGMWRDREDMADAAAYIRRIRVPRFKRDGSRDKPIDAEAGT